jgi:hypothetical protein
MAEGFLLLTTAHGLAEIDRSSNQSTGNLIALLE